MALKFVFGAFALATSSVITGLPHKSTHTFVTVQINGFANLLCPALDEVIGMDGTYTHVTWYWKTNNHWDWFVGMNQFGVTQALAKGVNISSDDGSLYISKVHLVNVTDFMCRVGRIKSRSSVRHFVTVRLRDGNEISNGNLTTPCNCTSPMDHIEPPKETSDGKLTSPCNCSEHCNCTSPPKETSNGNLTSPCNCSDHNNCTSPVDQVEPPKENCTKWIVGLAVVLVCCFGHLIVKGILIIINTVRHWCTHICAKAGEMRGTMRENGIELNTLRYSVPETDGNNQPFVPDNGGMPL